MSTNQVRTQAKDTLLVDEVRENPVDSQLTQNRKRLRWFLVLVAFLLVVLIIM